MNKISYSVLFDRLQSRRVSSFCPPSWGQPISFETGHVLLCLCAAAKIIRCMDRLDPIHDIGEQRWWLDPPYLPSVQHASVFNIGNDTSRSPRVLTVMVVTYCCCCYWRLLTTIFFSSILSDLLKSHSPIGKRTVWRCALLSQASANNNTGRLGWWCASQEFLDIP